MKDSEMTKETTTIGNLIEGLKKYPKDMAVDSFEMIYLDKRGYECKMFFNKSNKLIN